MTGEHWRLGRRPALDGLRALAIGLVVLAHGFEGVVPLGGTVGVTLFFVLSGFLITSLLVHERDDTGRIGLGAFYGRRALRLLPALGVLVVVALAGWAVLGARITTPREAFATMFYFGNWVRADGGTLGILSHTWSLAIEEQFYLVWPLVLIAALRLGGRRAALAVAAAGTLAAVASRVLSWDGAGSINRVYFSTDTRADALLLGCCVALVATGRKSWAYRAAPLALAVAACLVVSVLNLGDWFGYVAAPTLAAVAGLLALVALVGSGHRGIFSHPAAVYVGRRSYGLYLWHVPAFSFLNDATAHGVPHVAAFVILLSGAWTATYLSYRFIEAPFLRRKRDLEPSRPADEAQADQARV